MWKFHSATGLHRRCLQHCERIVDGISACIQPATWGDLSTRWLVYDILQEAFTRTASRCGDPDTRFGPRLCYADLGNISSAILEPVN